mmetsp:Transcript_11390/g.36005  ORF Transcript_11390/g.36005 Transcript_11390/m.36005 type:complete len:316 (+) Transcript_11390:149-1096(+)
MLEDVHEHMLHHVVDGVDDEDEEHHARHVMGWEGRAVPAGKSPVPSRASEQMAAVPPPRLNGHKFVALGVPLARRLRGRLLRAPGVGRSLLAAVRRAQAGEEYCGGQAREVPCEKDGRVLHARHSRRHRRRDRSEGGVRGEGQLGELDDATAEPPHPCHETCRAHVPQPGLGGRGDSSPHSQKEFFVCALPRVRLLACLDHKSRHSNLAHVALGRLPPHEGVGSVAHGLPGHVDVRLADIELATIAHDEIHLLLVEHCARQHCGPQAENWLRREAGGIVEGGGDGAGDGMHVELLCRLIDEGGGVPRKEREGHVL